MNNTTPEKNKPRQPISYTVGVPVAAVLFISLLIGAILLVRTNMPTQGERRAQAQAAVEVLRDRMPLVYPPDNTQLAGVTAYAETTMGITTLRIHGVLDRNLQAATIETMREAASELGASSIILEFYYPQERPEGLNPDASPSRIPIHSESPEPFRVERL
ncbi:MAG: hypothetical protein ACNA8P_08245 [Phycisphaerales bacterium]